MTETLRGLRFALLLAGLAVIACQDSPGPIDPEDGRDLTSARGPDGRSGAPEQIGLARAIAGFGGVFVARDGAPVVYLTDPGRLDAARGPLAGYLQRHGLDAAQLRVERAAFELAQLDRWFLAASPAVLSQAGVVFLDLDESRNQLTIGISDPGAERAIRATLSRLRIPEAAYALVPSDPIEFVATLRDRVRPTVGGLQIHFHIFLCTLGFNAVAAGAESFLTNSHCTMRQGGTEGTEYFQPLASVAESFLGIEVDDPEYLIGGECPRGFRCRYSDSSRAEYAAGVAHEVGQIARTEGLDIRSLEIVGEFRVAGETANPVAGLTVNKVGRTTGWTSGAVTRTCVDTGVSGSNYLLFCQAFVENPAGSVVVGGGDSGSPVFSVEQGPRVSLHGLLWGGNGAGTLFVFSPMSGIERELGPLATS
jgi:hypothetical protein